MSRRLWQTPPGYYWKVVVDPTRTGDYPGIFYGGHFRWSDIQTPARCEEDGEEDFGICPFPDGTVFENIKTGERVKIWHGQIVRQPRQADNLTVGSTPRRVPA